MKKLLATLPLLFLVSCASMNAEKCQTTDWEAKGTSDANYYHSNHYATYAEQCAEFGVVPDKARYTAGFEKGLIELCTFQNGYIIGNEGKTLPRICPSNLQEKFVQGFIQGQANYQNKQQQEKQNQLIEKAIDAASGKKPKDRCNSDYDCKDDGVCKNHTCHY